MFGWQLVVELLLPYLGETRKALSVRRHCVTIWRKEGEGPVGILEKTTIGRKSQEPASHAQ